MSENIRKKPGKYFALMDVVCQETSNSFSNKKITDSGSIDSRLHMQVSRKAL